jgi:hypothetical protein
MTQPDFRAVVTGASSGIGAAYARALRARGERVVLVARRAERLEALARELGGLAEVSVIPLDLTAPDAAARLYEATEARGHAVDLLVNNAGVGHTMPFADQKPAVVRAMLDLNVSALVELTRAYLPAMRARGRGRIVNVASTAAFQPIPYMAVYAATKAFVLSFTEALSGELRGSGVRVQALCPGVTGTEFLDVSETHRGLLITRMPTMRAEDVALASLAGLDRGRVRVVAGWPNRLLAFVTERLAPHALSRRVAGELYRPREGGQEKHPSQPGTGLI